MLPVVSLLQLIVRMRGMLTVMIFAIAISGASFCVAYADGSFKRA